MKLIQFSKSTLPVLILGFMPLAPSLTDLAIATNSSNSNPFYRNLPVEADPKSYPQGLWIAQSSLSRYRQQLLEADEFYRSGNLQAAKRIQSAIKPEFIGGGTAVTEPITDINSPQLSGAVAVYWRNAQEGIVQNLESKIFEPLQRLTENYPDFIPAHITFAEQCERDPVGCARSADGNQPTNAIDAIDRASALFPGQPDLTETHLQILIREAEKTQKPAPLLEASIIARQYALNYPDRPESRGYLQLVQQLEEEYKKQLQALVYSQVVFQSLFGQDQQALELMILGEAAFGEVQKQLYLESHPLLENPSAQAYVRRVGQNLAQWSGRSDFTYEFFVIDNPSPNAAAISGGKVFINSGLLELLQTEAELAGILSHEIAHTTLSHGYLELIEDQVSKDVATNLLGRNWGTAFGTFAVQIRNRKHERSADILGTRLLARSNYSADGLYIAMQRFAALEGNRQTSWTDSHPAGQERVLYLEDIILRNNYNRYGYEGVADYVGMQQSLRSGQVAAKPLSTSEENGAISGNNLTNSGVGSRSQTTLPPNPSTSVEPPTTVGLIPLSIVQEKTGVRLEIKEADVSTRGTYSLHFTIANNTNEPFIFVIPFSQVLNQTGDRVSAKFTCEGPSTVEAGESLSCECRVVGQTWQSGNRQNLILVLKEGTIGARVFRVGF